LVDILEDITIKKSDVLVIGAGSAGMKAAIDLSDAGHSVILVSKGPLAKSGITPLGFTGFTAFIGQHEEDSVDAHFCDTVISGRYLSNQKLVRTMAEKGNEVVHELIDFGLVFHKEKDGSLVQLKTPGMSAPRMLRIKGGGGSLAKCLAREVKKRESIDVWEDTIILDLMLTSGRVVGAAALSLRYAKGIFFSSKVTILATGGCEQLWPYNDCPPESTGDGYALALRAGAQIIDLEQHLFYPTVVIGPSYVKGLEISYEHLGVPGARMLNNSGKPVIFLTHPLPTRDELAREIYRENKKQNLKSSGGLFLDITQCEDSDKKGIKELLPAQSRLNEFGIDLTEQMLEVAPGAHTTLGGIKIDENGQTNVPGLFACGEVSGNVHGANRLPGNAYVETQVFGSLSAQHASTYARQSVFCIPPKKDIQELFISFLSFKSEGDEYRAWILKRKIQDTMWRGMALIRKKEGMLDTLNELQMMQQEDLPRLSIPRTKGYSLDLIEAIEAKNMLEVALIVTHSALHREESRGTHYREDFPLMDNQQWLRHTLIQFVDGALSIGDIPVEIDGIVPP
jgi:fumarate reductase (CoM/CoB) subunit A